MLHPGNDGIETRCRHYLEQAATGSSHSRETNNLLAFLWAGDTARAGASIRELIAQCDRRQDCMDFRLNLLLRALLLFPERIADAWQRDIRRIALAARYSGGFQRDYPMFYSSENHHLNWATAEYLAGQLWPQATFEYDGRDGVTHRLRATFCISRWIDERARWGFWEWNSSCYMGINLLSLLNLYDFCDHPSMRRMAGDGLTLMMADVAADSAWGGIWSAQARIYEPQLFSAPVQGAAAPLMLLMGDDRVPLPAPGMAGDFVATTRWRPDPWLIRLARELDPPMRNRERHRQPGKLRYTCHSIFWKPPVELWQAPWNTNWAPEEVTEICIDTERCPEYLVSAAYDPEPRADGPAGGQSVMWMSCLAGNVPIFVNQPPGDKDRFWAGNTVKPRCHLQDGIVGAVFHADRAVHAAADPFTHAYFPTPQMEETVRMDNWFLGKVGNAYIALRGCGKEQARQITQGIWAGKEIRLPGCCAAWVGVYGSARQDGSFTAFSRRVAAVQVGFDIEAPELRIVSDGNETRIPARGAILRNGVAVTVPDRPQISNPVCESAWGVPELIIRDGRNPARCLDLGYAIKIAKASYPRF